MIGHQDKFISEILHQPEFTILSCYELIGEIYAVASRDKFTHLIAETDLKRTIANIIRRSEHILITTPAVSEIRDKKDLFLLTLAEEGKADFIISGDKDLLILGKHNETIMMTLASFKEIVYRITPS